MQFYIPFYVLAAVLIFQGVQLLGEVSAPLGVVPAEVKLVPTPAGRWGGFLVTFGAAMVLAGLLSHGYPWFEGTLGLLRGTGLVIEALFGLWLIFGRKVDYVPAKQAGEPAHH